MAFDAVEREGGPRDSVYLLGDFAMSSKDGDLLEEIFAGLNGRKHLIVGNHDERNAKVLKLGWESVHDLATVRENGMLAVVCHYPLETWNRATRGALMLHGHSHGTLRRQLPRRFDVGVDAHGAGGPLKFEALLEMAAG